MEEKMYKAKIDIGGFKEGEEVPKEKAEIWMQMYKVSPVELVSKEAKKVVEVKKEENSSDFMLDDYLARGKAVVKKNIQGDKLGKEHLEKLLKLEKSNKKRKDVLRAIEVKLKQFN